jgi:cytochrome c556
MADESKNTPNVEENSQTQSAGGSGGGNEPRMFTQEQVNRMIQERLARAKSEPPADYEDLKAKAAKWDEADDARKSEIEKATEAAASAQKSASDWQAKFEALEAERQHELDVRKAAAEYGVDPDVLMRMGGDVEDNARLLQTKEAARPKYPTVHDGGEQGIAGQSLDEALKGVKSVSERIRIREQFNAKNRK